MKLVKACELEHHENFECELKVVVVGDVAVREHPRVLLLCLRLLEGRGRGQGRAQPQQHLSVACACEGVCISSFRWDRPCTCTCVCPCVRLCVFSRARVCMWQCKWGCGDPITVNKFSEHEESQCPMRVIACIDRCGSQVAHGRAWD
jgi:hypothetical protein